MKYIIIIFSFKYNLITISVRINEKDTLYGQVYFII